MFDYQYGTSTKRYKEKINQMSPKFPTLTSPKSKAMSYVFAFLSGKEILSLSSVCKFYYSGSWDTTLWRKLSKSLFSPEKCEALYKLAETKVQEFENSRGKNELLCAGTIKWRIVYIQLFYKFCFHCETTENKLRFLPVMQRTICFTCAKLPNFAMISLENAINEYGANKEDIDYHQLDGLSVPHTNRSGKVMFVYYLSDILRIIPKDWSGTIDKKKIRKNIEERRRTELVHYMQEEGISNEFINDIIDCEGTIPHSFVLGKSRMSSHKIAVKMGKAFRLQERKKIEKEKEKEKKVKNIKKKECTMERKKTNVSDEAKNLRKIQLIERLSLMGLDTDQIDFEDPESLAYEYVQGKSRKKDLGSIAGVLWREFKPVFTGISSKTTQRITDL